MDHFDDIQIEEYYPSDFIDEIQDEVFDEDEDERAFYQFLNSNYEQ